MWIQIIYKYACLINIPSKHIYFIVLKHKWVIRLLWGRRHFIMDWGYCVARTHKGTTIMGPASHVRMLRTRVLFSIMGFELPCSISRTGYCEEGDISQWIGYCVRHKRTHMGTPIINSHGGQASSFAFHNGI